MILARDLGIDLGTANSVVYLKSKGIVLNEPSVVALEKESKKVLAVGIEAKRMVGRTPGNIIAIRPMRDGVIADFDITKAMLRYFMNRVFGGNRFLTRPRMVIGIPSGVTPVEERAVREAAIQAGAKEAYLIEEPMAAAIGIGLPVQEPQGSMVVDIGGGTTEIAVISLGGIVTSQSIRLGGDELDETITQYIKKSYNLMIGERTAEDIKIMIGAAYFNATPEDEERRNKVYPVRGRDLVSGLPQTVELNAKEIQEALTEPIQAIVDAVKICLEKTPPELAADIMERGIMMTGGGSLLWGIDKLLSKETGMPVFIAEEPLYAVARGTGKTLDNLEILKKVSFPSFSRREF